MKILIAEDDVGLARFLVRMLGEEGMTADVSHTGPLALAQARTGIYQLLVLDWMLPGLDGLSLCRQLRQEGSTVPILMLTARGELRERVLGLDTGADDFLVKPFEIDELLARIRALLRRSAGMAPMRVGTLEIDRISRCAVVDAIPIQLTATEFALMLHLAHRVDRVVPRTELLDQVWGMRMDPGTNIIEVAVSRLRHKLGPEGWRVETVRGVGYRLQARESP